MAGTNGATADGPLLAWPAEPPRLHAARILVDRVCRWLLAIVFLMAAVSKITDLQGFDDQIRLHSGLPYVLGTALAAFLPWVELTCAGCLLFGRAVREASAILAILLAGFLVYALLHPAEADCGCFVFPTLHSSSTWWWPVGRDSLLLLAGLRRAWRTEALPGVGSSDVAR